MAERAASRILVEPILMRLMSYREPFWGLFPANLNPAIGNTINGGVPSGNGWIAYARQATTLQAWIGVPVWTARQDRCAREQCRLRLGWGGRGVHDGGAQRAVRDVILRGRGAHEGGLARHA